MAFLFHLARWQRACRGHRGLPLKELREFYGTSTEHSSGEILCEEFLNPLGITAYRLAKDIHVPATRIAGIFGGKRGISAETALRLSRYFGNSAQFWLNLQAHYELRETQQQCAGEVAAILPCEKLPLAA